jgi:UDP-N-acetylglucosamine 4,6-dehydratase
MDTLLIFGGTGCMGKYIIQQNIDKFQIVNFSRDEHKQWNLDQIYGRKIQHVIGDALDKDLVKQTLLRYLPHRIYIIHALKHVDRCQENLHACIQTNLLSTKTVLDTIEELYPTLKERLQTVIFLSTDKATSPVNAYGMCKALSEFYLMEKARYCQDVKFVGVRYGNVTSSTSSIIPLLLNNKDPVIYLTDERMTRFWMTIDEAYQAIEYAIQYGSTGQIVIPKIPAFYIKDLLEIFAEAMGKTVQVTGLRPGERLYEVLINDTQSLKTTEQEKYYFIGDTITRKEPFIYDSNQNIMTKKELFERVQHYITK